MTRPIYVFFLTAGLVGLNFGCQTSPTPRVVRLGPSAGGIEWRYSVNGHEENGDISVTTLTNRLARLKLRHGDIVLLGGLPGVIPSYVKPAYNWMAEYFDSRKVALYVYPPSKNQDVFLFPVLHWTAPFDNPRGLGESRFYSEGQFLGEKLKGFHKMVSKLSQNRLRKIFILGSLYDKNSGFGPVETPYESYDDILQSALKENGIEILIPSSLLGFK